MEQIEELFHFIREIKSPGMITNAVFTAASLRQLGETTEVKIKIGHRAAAVFHHDVDNILRVFFYAADQEALKEVPALVPPASDGTTRVCDILGKDPHLQALRAEMLRAGFRFYARFQRMICKNLPTSSPLDFSRVEFAGRSDIAEIQEMLHTEFDPLTAHFPSDGELERLADQKEIFVIRGNGEIAGFTVFESCRKQVACLRYVITRPRYRGRYIARTLLFSKMIDHNDSRYYYLWINEIYQNAVLNHEKNGFFKDGTYDDIFII